MATSSKSPIRNLRCPKSPQLRLFNLFYWKVSSMQIPLFRANFVCQNQDDTKWNILPHPAGKLFSLDDDSFLAFSLLLLIKLKIWSRSKKVKNKWSSLHVCVRQKAVGQLWRSITSSDKLFSLELILFLQSPFYHKYNWR